MADQDNQQDGNSLFHELGQHISNSLKDFIESRKSYGESHPVLTPEQSLQQAESSTVVGEGAQPIAQDQMSQMGIPQQAMGQNVPQTAPIQVPMVPQIAPQQGAQAVPNPAPVIPQAQPNMGGGSAGLPNALKAQSDLAHAAQDASQGIQDVYDSGLAKQKELVDASQQHFQNNEKQDQQLRQAYLDHKMDPNRVINSMSTGNKIMTSLGLLFSGIGSGLTGDKNLALEMINNNVAKDLEVQKANREQAYNAYQMHREGTKDEFTADLQHQKDNLLAIDSAIEQQKAKLIGPQAIAAATQTQLGIRNQIMDLNQKSAVWQATKQSLSNQNGSPESKIRTMQLTGQIKPEQAEKAFQELDKVRNHGKQESTIMASFDQANKENTLSGRLAHAGSVPASVAALQNQVMPYLKDAEGRINETEIKRLDSLIPAPGDSPHKIDTKRKALQDFIKEKSGSSLLKGLGINAESAQPEQPAKTGTSKSGKPIIMNSQGKWEYAK